MASIFTRIISGELPSHTVYADDAVVAIVDIKPQTRGHLLVIPREEIDAWTDLPDALRDRLFAVAQRIGKVLPDAFGADRCGVVIAGYGVPHTHVHLIPINRVEDLDPAAAHDVPDEQLAAVAREAREALRAAGIDGVVG